MSELRQNLATREWVVIAPERGEKPSSIKSRIARSFSQDVERMQGVLSIKMEGDCGKDRF